MIFKNKRLDSWIPYINIKVTLSALFTDNELMNNHRYIYIYIYSNIGKW